MNNRRVTTVLLVTLFLLLIWALIGLISPRRTEEAHPVSVILSDSGNERYTALKQGMEQAAKDYSIELTIVSTEELLRAEDEVQLLEREAEQGAEGIIFVPVEEEGYTELLSRYERTVSFMLLRSDIAPAEAYPSVISDDERIGRMLAAEVTARFGENLSGRTVLLLNPYPRMRAMKLREEAFLEALSKSGGRMVLLSDAPGDLSTALPAAMAKEQPDAVVALDNVGTEMTIDLLTETGQAGVIPLFGADYSEKAVYSLDKGIVSTLIVSNDFNIGYLSVQKIYRELHGEYGGDDSASGIYRVTRENLYAPETERIVFPIAQ